MGPRGGKEVEEGGEGGLGTLGVAKEEEGVRGIAKDGSRKKEKE